MLYKDPKGRIKSKPLSIVVEGKVTCNPSDEFLFAKGWSIHTPVEPTLEALKTSATDKIASECDSSLYKRWPLVEQLAKGLYVPLKNEPDLALDVKTHLDIKTNALAAVKAAKTKEELEAVEVEWPSAPPSVSVTALAVAKPTGIGDSTEIVDAIRNRLVQLGIIKETVVIEEIIK